VKKIHFYIIALLSAAFVSGVIVTHYKIFPFYHLVWIKNFIEKPIVKYNFLNRNELYKAKPINFLDKYAFIDDLINKKLLMNSSVKSIDELSDQVENITSKLDLIWSPKSRRKILDITKIKNENIYK